LSTLGETIAAISAQRQSDPKKLSQTVRGELDWIAMKALEKERTRRYETANGLARDVERYLADEPVEACPPTRIYRLRKFARRNRAAMAGCLLLTAALLIGLGGVAGGVGWAIRDRAEREHRADLQRAAQQERVSTQLQAILDEVARLETDQKWSEALIAARRAEPALASGEAAQDVEQRVRRTLADLQLVHRLDKTREQSGMAWGVSDFDHAESGLPYQAEKEYSAAFRDAGMDVDVLPAEEAAARILSRRAVAAAVLPAMDDWVAVRESLKDSSGADRLNAVLRRADPDAWRQRVRDALARKNWAAVVALAKSADVDRQPAATICFLGAAIGELGRPFGSERYELQVNLLRRAQSRYPSDFWINHKLGTVLVLNVPSGAPEGMSYLRAAVAVRPDNGHALMNLGSGYDALGQPEQAIACYRKAVELAPESAVCYYDLGRALTIQDHYAEAIGALQKCVRCDPDHQDSGHQEALGYLVVCYTALHQPQRATECEHRLRAVAEPRILRILPTTLPSDPRQAGDQLRRRAKLHAQLGDFAKAKEELSESLPLHSPQIARVQLACIELYLGNEQAYSDLRDHFLVGDTSGTKYKLQLAEAGLLRPASAVQLSNSAKWIEAGSTTPQAATGPSTAPASQPKPTPPIQLLLAHGMLDYRQGDLRSASQRFLQCVNRFNNLSPGGRSDESLERAVAAEFYLAICQYRLSQPAEAEESLADARKCLDRQLGPLRYGASQYGSVDWLIAHIAAREAEATIHPQPTTAPAPTSQP
jgi:tetratricopeptide (TPR) repeat protein